MKPTCLIALAVLCLVAPSAPAVGPDEPEPVYVAAELLDGSRIVGTLVGRETLPFHTQLGQVDIPFRHLDRITLQENRESVVLEFRNGDRLTGFMKLPSLKLRTLVGDLDVSFSHIARLSVWAAAGLPEHLRRGLVLYYDFDKPEFGRATDLSGHGNHAKLHGAVRVDDGRVGGAMAFSRDSYIDAGNGPGLNCRRLTFAAWVHMSTNSNNYLWAYKGAIGGSTMSYGLQFYQANALYFYAGSTSNQKRMTGLGTLHGRWTHVAVTYDGGGGMQIYIDGQLRSGRIQASGRPGAIPVSSESFKIGRWGGHGFSGMMDDVMLFNRVLSASEIRDLVTLRT